VNRRRRTFQHSDLEDIWKVVAAKRKERGDLAGCKIAARNAKAAETSHEVGMVNNLKMYGEVTCC
jgi:hypothetical protein